MYSYPSAAALTRVSVPSTGRAKASRTMKASPTTFPCITPMTSMSPPERAWVAILRSASAEMRTLLRWVVVGEWWVGEETGAGADSADIAARRSK